MKVQPPDLAALAKALKDAGEKELRRELFRGINRAVKPLRAEVKQSALDMLPKRGGFAAEIAASRFVTSTKTGRDSAGVRLVVRNPKRSLYHPNRGVIRHRRGDGGWTEQQITPGFFDKPVQADAADVRRELEAAMTEVARKLDRAF